MLRYDKLIINAFGFDITHSLLSTEKKIIILNEIINLLTIQDLIALLMFLSSNFPM